MDAINDWDLVRDLACPSPVLSFAYDPFTFAFFAMVALTASIAMYFTVLACIRIAKFWSRKEETYCPNPHDLEPNLEALEAAQDGPVPVNIQLVKLPSLQTPKSTNLPAPRSQPPKPKPHVPLEQVERTQDMLREAMDKFRDRMEGLERQLDHMEQTTPTRGIVRVFCPSCRAVLIFDEIRRGEWIQISYVIPLLFS